MSAKNFTNLEHRDFTTGSKSVGVASEATVRTFLVIPQAWQSVRVCQQGQIGDKKLSLRQTLQEQKPRIQTESGNLWTQNGHQIVKSPRREMLCSIFSDI